MQPDLIAFLILLRLVARLLKNWVAPLVLRCGAASDDPARLRHYAPIDAMPRDSSPPFAGSQHSVDATSEWQRRHSVVLAVPTILLIALVLRILMAWRLDVISRDGAYFIRAARAFAIGDRNSAFAYAGFNIYPPILAGLAQIFGDYEIAAKFWGVVTSTLTVLPLWGYFRRLFDDRIARFSCLLYACHPGLIETAPEPLRDSTYWLLLALTLYAYARAREKSSLTWCFLSGVIVLIAIHTRTESWLLFFPLLWTSVFPSGFSPAHPRQAVARLATTTFPILLTYAVCTAASLYETEVIGFGRVNAVRTVSSWADKQVASPSNESAPEPTPTTAMKTQRSKYLSRYITRFAKAFTIVIGIGCLFGLLRFGKIAFSAEQLPVTAMNFTLLALIWIYLAEFGDFNTRYFYTIVICTLPFAALFVGELERRLALGGAVSLQHAYVMRIAVGIVLCSSLAAFFHRDLTRDDEALLGRWIRQNYGNNVTVACFHHSYLVLHHADVYDFVPLSYPPIPEGLRQIQSHSPELLILQVNRSADSDCAAFTAELNKLAYRELPLPAVLQNKDAFRLYVRDVPQTASPQPLYETQFLR